VTPTGPVGGELLASGQQQPTSLFVDATDVYWGSEAFDGAVMRLSKAGGTPTTLIDNQYQPAPVLVEDGYIYWAAGGGTFLRRLLNGTTTEILNWGDETLVEDADAFYWGVGGRILERSRTTGDITTLAAGLPQLEPNLVLANSRIYCALEDGKIVSLPISGGEQPVTEVGGLSAGGVFIATDGTSLYWVDETARSVSSWPLGGGAVRKLADTGAEPAAIGVVDGFVYWANMAPCSLDPFTEMIDPTKCIGNWPSLQKMPVAGGPITTIATGYLRILAIAFDDTYVYWADYDAGTISRAPK
jgi:hypothetical protein